MKAEMVVKLSDLPSIGTARREVFSVAARRCDPR